MRIQPGDVVRVIKTDNSLIKEGSLGVVEAIREGWGYRGVRVTFNYCVPWVNVEDGKRYVSASGGPERLIPIEWLRPTDEIIEYKAHLVEEGDVVYQSYDKFTVVKARVWEVALSGWEG